MFISFSLLLLYFKASSPGDSAAHLASGRRIYYGYDAEIQKYPHAVFLHFHGTRPSSCGSSLVTTQAVLTAAHCVDELRYERGAMHAYLGALVPRMATVVKQVVGYMIHPEYNERRGSLNIAVAFFNSRVTLSATIQRISLANINPPSDSIVFSVGWGRQNINKYKTPRQPMLRSLQASKQRVVNRMTCANDSQYRVTASVLCTVPVMGHMHIDDSGDGLVLKSTKKTLCGVLSHVVHGVNVYTGVTRNKDWIKKACYTLCQAHCTDHLI